MKRVLRLDRSDLNNLRYICLALAQSSPLAEDFIQANRQRAATMGSDLAAALDNGWVIELEGGDHG